MTTSVRQPTLADKATGQVVVSVARLLKRTPPDGALVEYEPCDYPCWDGQWTMHLGIWVPVYAIHARIVYWTWLCLVPGCDPVE